MAIRFLDEEAEAPTEAQATGKIRFLDEPEQAAAPAAGKIRFLDEPVDPFADLQEGDIPEAETIVRSEGEQRFEDFKRAREIEENKPFTQQAKEFGSGALQVIKSIPGEISKFAGEVQRVGAQDPAKLVKSLIEGGAKGGLETGKLAKDLIGSAGDLFVDEEQEIIREFMRSEQDQKLQEVFNEQGLLFDPSDVNQTITAGGSILLDPTNFLGVGAVSKLGKGVQLAGKGLKKTGKGAQLGEKIIKTGKKIEGIAEVTEVPNRVIKRGLRVATKTTAGAAGIGLKFVAKTAEPISLLVGAPRRTFVKIATKMGVPSRFANTAFASASAIPGGKPVVLGLLATEGLGKATSKTSKLLSDISLILSKPSTQIRFLERIAMSDNVAKPIKRLAAIAGSRGTQKALDMAFDAIGDGVSAGTIQVALTFAAKDLTAEQLGQQFGTGFAFGAPLGAALGQRGAGISPKAREDASIKRFMKTKADKFQREQIGQLPRESQVLLGSLADGGFRSDIEVLDKDTFNTLLSKELADGGIAIDEAAAPAIFTTSDGTIFINGNARNKNNITSALTHEMGERLAKGILNNDPAVGGDPNLLANIKNSLVDNEKGFTVNLPGEGDLKLNKDAAVFAKRYNQENPDAPIQDTNDLVHKMVSEDIANIVTDRDFKIDGLAAKTPQSKQAVFKVLDTMFERLGLVHPETGNVLKDLAGLSRSASIKRSLRNHLALKDNLQKGISETNAKRPNFILENGKTHQQKVKEIDSKAEVVTASDIDPNVKVSGKVTENFFGNRELDANRLGRETGLGKTNEGQWIDPLLLDNLQISKKGKMIVTDFTKSIRDFSKVKIWRKSKDELKPDLEGVPYAFQINKQGGINVQVWDQRRLSEQIGKLIDSKPEIGSVSDVMGRIEDARIRQSQGQRINDDLVAALLGARPELIKDPQFKDIAIKARKDRDKPGAGGGIFITVPLKNIAGFRDLGEPGLAVRVKDLLTNPER